MRLTVGRGSATEAVLCGVVIGSEVGAESGHASGGQRLCGSARTTRDRSCATSVRPAAVYGSAHAGDVIDPAEAGSLTPVAVPYLGPGEDTTDDALGAVQPDPIVDVTYDDKNAYTVEGPSPAGSASRFFRTVADAPARLRLTA
ncbi:hypothetical protein [Streptomyces sp. NPDC006368]|uniref:hypothetical protein n=1 Tax=Streptomyces sp. NPDC006368 TaxID=3156760 RepID=UPI0033B13597